ncbi:unnamed protein product [Larinioides sclopetarius]|uniref:Uncharacterized protein n=1 Tax=Larinioides sclopetarius TaxID=280406 RepID=A0AAV1YUB4_9ARAC
MGLAGILYVSGIKGKPCCRFYSKEDRRVPLMPRSIVVVLLNVRLFVFPTTGSNSPVSNSTTCERFPIELQQVCEGLHGPSGFLKKATDLFLSVT